MLELGTAANRYRSLIFSLALVALASCSEDDSAINPYITVGLAPYGPAEAFR